MKLFRVVVPVADIERATMFYAALLQQPGMRVSAGRHYFNCDGVILACYDPAADGDSIAPRPIPEPFYFAVDNLEATYQLAIQAGATLSTDSSPGVGPLGTIALRPWGEHSFYASDPFGNPLCFVSQDTVYTGDSPRVEPAHPGGVSTYPSTAAAIARLRERYVEAFNHRRAGAVAELHTVDSVHMPAGLPTIKGRHAIRDHMARSLAAMPDGMTFTFEALELQLATNWAVERGTTPGTAPFPSGKYVMLYRHEPDGQWRIAWTITNHDGPVPSRNPP